MISGRRQRKTTVIIEFGSLLCAAALVAVGLHHLLGAKPCSVARHAHPGAVVVCPSRVGAWAGFLVAGAALMLVAAWLWASSRQPAPYPILGAYLADGEIAVTRSASTFATWGAVWLVVAALVWAAALLGPVELSRAVAGHIRIVHRQRPAPPAVTQGEVSPPTGIGAIPPTDALSLFSAGNLRWALHTAHLHLGRRTRLNSVVLFPGYLDVTAVNSAGLLEFQIDAEGHWRMDRSGGSDSGNGLFAWKQMDPSVPSAIAQEIDNDVGVPESELNDMVAEVDPSSGKFTWIAYTRPPTPAAFFETSAPGAPLYEDLTSNSGGLELVG